MKHCKLGSWAGWPPTPDGSACPKSKSDSSPEQSNLYLRFYRPTLGTLESFRPPPRIALACSLSLANLDLGLTSSKISNISNNFSTSKLQQCQMKLESQMSDTIFAYSTETTNWRYEIPLYKQSQGDPRYGYSIYSAPILFQLSSFFRVKLAWASESFCQKSSSKYFACFGASI